MPGLEACYQELKDQGLAVVALSVSEDRAAMTRVRDDKKLTIPLAVAGDTVLDSFDVSSIPLTYVVDKSGTMRLRMKGYHSQDDFCGAVRPHLRETASASK